VYAQVEFSDVRYRYVVTDRDPRRLMFVKQNEILGRLTRSGLSARNV
jgi:hypothetical protein